MTTSPGLSLRATLVIAGAAAAIAVLVSAGCIIYLNPLCTDQIRNGEETDVDCGGDTCGPCAYGARCSADKDCEDGICQGGTCAPLPCFNGKQDPGETDVDCGGATCRKCSGGRTCTAGTDCFSNTCVTGSNKCSGLSVVSFAPSVRYEAGNKTYILFGGDMDGDTDIDLVAGNELDSTMMVYRNDGTGTFQRIPALFKTGEYPTGGTIADFNKDGIPDVATANFHGNSVSILLGQNNGSGKGTGSLGMAFTTDLIPDAETTNLAVGDLDNDGDLDVIASNLKRGSVSEYLNRGDGTLAPAVDLTVGAEGTGQPFSVAIDDFNGDGKNDVAIANMTNLAIIVRLGNGDGTFQGEVLYAEGGTPPYIIISSDIDKDGKKDLVCANRGSSDVSVLLGRGDGTFRKSIVSSTGAGTGPYAIAVADFNQDGVPDVATPNFESSTASVLLGIGSGAFEKPIDVGNTGMTTYGIVAQDLNGDGKPDLAVSNAVSNDVLVKLSTAH